MPIDVRRYGRADADRLIDALCSWAPPSTYGGYLQAGDVGWALRLDDEDLDGALLCLVGGRGSDDVVAVALVDGPGVLRPAIRPDRVHDRELAVTLADLAAEACRGTTGYSDAAAGSTYRSVLSERGWVVDPDPWVVLYRGLSAADGEYDDPWSTTLSSPRDVADRVEVQRSAFEGSTFTVRRWHQMATGPGFDPALEMLRRDESGVPVAAATAWSSGPGRCGVLEPVGTHRGHGGRGHGTAVSKAVIAALARSGASGVTVHTPAFNTAALRTYVACGLRQVEISHAMTRRATA